MTTGLADAMTSHEVTYLEAISQALDEEMSRDERVFLMGEDIGAYGGAFKITEGFLQKYGDHRVLDTRGHRRRHDGPAACCGNAVCRFYFLRV
jgi:hypothetical protein